jgi:hypothetical protein
LLKCLWRPRWQSRYLDCHRRFRGAYLAGAGWLEQRELDRRIARLHLAMLVARVAGRSKVEYITEPGVQERVKKFAVDHLLGKVERTDDIAMLWEQALNEQD